MASTVYKTDTCGALRMLIGLLSSTAWPRLGTWSIFSSLVEFKRFFYLKNLASHVYWTIDLHSSLYVINLPHSYRGMKLDRNFFLLL